MGRVSLCRLLYALREWHGGAIEWNKCALGGIAVLPLSLPMEFTSLKRPRVLLKILTTTRHNECVCVRSWICGPWIKHFRKKNSILLLSVTKSVCLLLFNFFKKKVYIKRIPAYFFVFSQKNSKLQIGDKPVNYKVYTAVAQCIPGNLLKKPAIIKLLIFPKRIVT